MMTNESKFTKNDIQTLQYGLALIMEETSKENQSITNKFRNIEQLKKNKRYLEYLLKLSEKIKDGI